MDELEFLKEKYEDMLASASSRFKIGSSFYGHAEDSFMLANVGLEDVVPSYIFEPSKFRKNGYMLWDMIMKTLSRTDVSHDEESTSKPIKPEERWNKLWADIKFSSKRQAYSYFTKDSIDLPYHIDLSKETRGFEFYKAIHSLSHMWADPIAAVGKKKYWPYVYPRWIPYAAANAAVSILYDQGIYIGEGRQSKTWAVPVTNGLRIYPSTSVNNPSFLVPITDLTSNSNIDKLFGCVFVYVYIQPPPTTFEDPLDVHKFATGPGRMLVAGWETVDFILNCPTVFANRQRCIAVNVMDLLDPSTLPLYHKQRTSLGLTPEGTKFKEWTVTDAYNKELQAPSVPDRQCAILLPEFEDRPIPSKHVIGQARYKRRRKDLFDKIKSAVLEYERSIRATDDEKKELRHRRADCNKGYIHKMYRLKQIRKSSRL